MQSIDNAVDLLFKNEYDVPRGWQVVVAYGFFSPLGHFLGHLSTGPSLYEYPFSFGAIRPHFSERRG